MAVGHNPSSDDNAQQQIENLYRQMCQAMIDKDTATLNRLHADDFVLIHMTGMRQTKQQYINAIADGTLNYYSAEHDRIEVSVHGDRATLTGRSRVCAAVFGGGRHTWPLQLRFDLVFRNNRWQLSRSVASTY